jgi:hypothetical protein
MCGVGNAPPDPLGGDKSANLVMVLITYGAGAQVAASGVLPRLDATGNPEGINVFLPRISPQFARDFLGIRQADQTVVLNQAPGSPASYQTLVVDDVGVKVVDDATWNTTLTPVFEMRGPAPWLHRTDSKLPGDYLTSYEEEIAGGTIVSEDSQPRATRAPGMTVVGLGKALSNWVTDFGDPTVTGVYPPLISEPRLGLDTTAWNALRASALAHLNAYAQAGAAGGPSGEIQFLPTFAKRLRNGMYLIVNGYPNPYLSGGPLDVMARSTSEVLRVDPSLPVGQRIVRTLDQQPPYALDLYTWDHFMVPDPGRSEYPRLRGGAAPLRQPRAADMR